MFKTFLKADIDRCVNAVIDGQTLLIIAIKHDHYEIVEFLVNQCNADIEQVGVLCKTLKSLKTLRLCEIELWSL